MFRVITILLLAAVTLCAANQRLYLTDGNFHMVKEYEVQGQRVRYLSAERDQWEQIPLTMVDLKRTESEAAEREAVLAAELAIEAEEDEARRRQRAEIARVPVNVGAYYINGDQLIPIELAETTEHESSTRKILKILTPVPIIAMHVTITIEGETADLTVKNRRPEFYLRLRLNERFGIVKLKPKDKQRVVESMEILPEDEEIIEEILWVDVFRQQAENRLYRIWPQADLEPGEYGLIEYTEGQHNIMVWPFRVE